MHYHMGQDDISNKNAATFQEIQADGAACILPQTVSCHRVEQRLGRLENDVGEADQGCFRATKKRFRPERQCKRIHQRVSTPAIPMGKWIV